MPHTVRELIDLLELEQLDENLYRGRQAETSRQRVFGGQVAAQALRAACHTVADDRGVHSLHAYFLLPGDPSIPILYDVERIRDGGSFSTRRVVARQHGRSIFYLTASFQIDEQGFEHQDVMPAAPPPEDCPPLTELLRKGGVDPEIEEHFVREWAALEVRYAGDSRPGGEIVDPDQPARSRIWFRAAGSVPDDHVIDTCVLTYASDLTLLGVSLVPHGVIIGTSSLQSASLDHSMWFHRRFRSDAWMLYEQHSPSASGARGMALGRVFGDDGSLIATVAQEGLIRPIRRTRASSGGSPT